LEELPEEMERDIEHQFGGLEIANGDDEGRDTDDDDKIEEEEVAEQMFNLPVPPK
jgi:hypothetical protein